MINVEIAMVVIIIPKPRRQHSGYQEPSVTTKRITLDQTIFQIFLYTVTLKSFPECKGHTILHRDNQDRDIL